MRPRPPHDGTGRAYAVPFRLSIDCFEGPRKQIAVLLTDDGRQINIPKALLPRTVQRDLKKTDPGHDIKH